MLSETGFDGKLSRYTYNPAGELVQENRYHHQNHQQLLQTTVYHRDRLGRIIQKDSHWADNTHSESSRYFYDKLSRVTRAHNAHSEIRLSYNSEGLLAKEQFYLLKEPIRYDVIQCDNYLHSQTTEYQYDVLGNRSQTLLPTGDVLNYLYYGSGHLHHINFNGETITDIERDNLHRPIVRSAGQLNTQFQFDPMGRLKQQISQLAQYDSSNQSALIGRQYHYDATGNLIRTDDQLNGNTDYAYDPLGRILQAADERFAFDPAHNISDDDQTVMGNRLMEYNGVRYRYDGLGNLTERHSDTESQFYHYDANNQLIEARIEKATMPTQYWQYRYDPFGRRMLKINAKTKQETLFTWEGSRLLQELRQDKVYTYVYTEQNSYEPLAQIETFRQPEKLNTPIIRYFHTDQIGIPREMTDEAGNIVWRGQYSGWGKLLHEEKANNHIHQPFRLQNQYADEETGLYYNFFRYYDAHCGRFTQQDPIGLMGGDNLYSFAPNTMGWIDSLGLYNAQKCASIAARIQNLKDEIYKKRIPALQSNPQNLPWRIGPGEALRDTVRGHVTLLNAAYSKLAKAEKEWVDNGCDKPPPPSAPATKCTSCSSKQEKSKSNKNYLLIAGLGVVAVAAVLSPFDGPFGDAAAIGALGGALAQ